MTLSTSFAEFLSFQLDLTMLFVIQFTPLCFVLSLFILRLDFSANNLGLNILQCLRKKTQIIHPPEIDNHMNDEITGVANNLNDFVCLFEKCLNFPLNRGRFDEMRT